MGSEQYELLYEYSLDVLKDHQDFKEVVPHWYKAVDSELLQSAVEAPCAPRGKQATGAKINGQNL